MSVRNLGDWSPLDLDKDPVYADPDEIEKARARYANIASKIDDAGTRLQKIVDQGSDGLAGKYADGLKKGVGTIKDDLAKAGVRYHDVAKQIGIYQDELKKALDETADELKDAQHAKDAQTKAHSLPDGQKGTDGSLPPDEQKKDDDKRKAISDADGALAAARKRLDGTLERLNTAGKAFGDAVNCKNYDDGLTDKLKDKVAEVMQWISKIFTAIGLFLGALAILIPGVDLIVIAGLAATAVGLIANIQLYTAGQGSVVDIVLGAIGLGLGAVGLGVSLWAKGMAIGAGKVADQMGGMHGVPGRPPQLNFNPGWNADDIELSNLRPGEVPGPGPSGPGVSSGWQSAPGDFSVPNIPAAGKSGLEGLGFWNTTGQQFANAWNMWSHPGSWTQLLSNLAGSFGGWVGASDLAAIMQSIGGKISPLWYVWGGLNGAFNLGAGIGFSGYQIHQWVTEG